ncbi:MAG: hypothetical protein NUV80_02825 [Candidatus Berkelbacteria bacterium]|nr:hypothetical protein [Candidatus Berkelbacteria bacterium]
MGKANDFEKDMERLRSLIKQSKELNAALKAIELSESLGVSGEATKKYRLPYSSNPSPVGEPWRS